MATKAQQNTVDLYPIHTSKTCLVKQEVYNWIKTIQRTEKLIFYGIHLWSPTYHSNVPNFKLTNICLSSFYEEKNLNSVLKKTPMKKLLSIIGMTFNGILVGTELVLLLRGGEDDANFLKKYLSESKAKWDHNSYEYGFSFWYFSRNYCISEIWNYLITMFFH